MRNLLFKGISKITKDWVEGLPIQKNHQWYITIQDDASGMLLETEVYPTTICQCTEMLDIKQNLLWENDIVERTLGGHTFQEIVRYSGMDGCYVAADKYGVAYRLGQFARDYKRVGNIFDDLLKKGRELNE